MGASDHEVKRAVAGCQGGAAAPRGKTVLVGHRGQPDEPITQAMSRRTFSVCIEVGVRLPRISREMINTKS